jgi:hypothetical protein
MDLLDERKKQAAQERKAACLESTASMRDSGKA